MKRMTAALFHEHGGREVLHLERVPMPAPAAGEVRIKVAACALNWLDVGIRRDRNLALCPCR